jgi:S-DNA-T family DNA segregation ATPase FtsK/SpoIIIE
MALYHDIPHLLSPVITEPEKCISALKWAVAEMERRLKAFPKLASATLPNTTKSNKKKACPTS